MKKSLIVMAAMLLTYNLSQAQTEKGTQTAGFNLGLSTQQQSNLNIDQTTFTASNSKAQTTIFNIGPQYSYFIAAGLDMAFSINYNSTVTNLQNTLPNIIEPYRQSNKNLDVQAAIRKYWMHKNKIGLRTEAFLSYGHEQNESLYTDQTYNSVSTANYPQVGLGLDLVYYPTKNLGLSAVLANLNYENFKESNGPEGDGSGHSFNFTFINNGLSFSIFYAFGGKG